MNTMSKLFSAAVVAITLISSSGIARADALPEDACAVEDLGKACNNAGDHADEPGVCQTSTCTKSLPNGDGGFTTSTSDCTLCEPSDGGTPATDGGKATTTRDDAGTGSSASSSSSGCSATPNTRDGSAAFAMIAVGIIGLVLGRRKRA